MGLQPIGWGRETSSVADRGNAIRPSLFYPSFLVTMGTQSHSPFRFHAPPPALLRGCRAASQRSTSSSSSIESDLRQHAGGGGEREMG